jgi:hypothetical protein
MFAMMSVGSSARTSLPEPPTGEDPFEWYPALDLNTIPWHTASGDWGSQYTMPVAAAPTITASAAPTTFAGFVTACNAGGRFIRIANGVTIDCDGDISSFNTTLSDLDIVIEPGGLLRDWSIGSLFGDLVTINRVRIRGTTVGSHSGGQLHNFDVIGSGNASSRLYDCILDGIDVTGGDATDSEATNAFKTQIRGARLNVVNCRFASGGEGYIGEMGDTIWCGNSFLTALTNPETVEDESWGTRITTNATGSHIFFENDMRASTGGRSDVFHRARFHPGPEGSGHVWMQGNTFVDRIDGFMVACVANLESTAHGWYESFMTDSNRYYFESATNFSLISESAIYNSFTNETFYGNASLTNTQIGVSSTINPTDETPPGINTTKVTSGNTFNAGTTDPAWGGAGDPSGLNWDI